MVRAQTDPVAGAALRLLHEDPAYPWNVTELASRVGVSRASLARRFTTLVGKAPMSSLTGWRIPPPRVIRWALDRVPDTVRDVLRRFPDGKPGRSRLGELHRELESAIRRSST